MSIRRSQNKPSRREQLKVMIVGDSMARGITDATVIQQGGMRLRLMKGINARLSMPARFVGGQFSGPGYMCGTSGLTVTEIFASPYLLDQLIQFAPDVIQLHIGTNDCTQLQSGGTPTLTTTRAALTAGLNLIRSVLPRCKVIISRIVDNQTAHAQVVNFNDLAIGTDVVARADYIAGLVVICDEYTAVGLYSATNYLDGTHLNDTGNQLRVPALQASFNTLY
jgi:lysophospholipase L1-like esterase